MERDLVDLGELLESVANDYAQRASEKNIEIAVFLPHRIKARLNPSLIRQAIGNLIDNAIKYSPQGTSITVEARQDESSLTISVADQGQGIPKKHIPRIFERFYRVDKARSREMGGTGLGLSIVKHIVNLHKGRIEVESEVGKGSTFTIVLPKEP